MEPEFMNQEGGIKIFKPLLMISDLDLILLWR